MPSPATAAVELGLRMFHGLPVFLAGSTVVMAEDDKGMGHDLDAFVSIPRRDNFTLGRALERALQAGFSLPDRMEQAAEDWTVYGVPNWQTNSLRLLNDDGLELNLIGKTVEGQPVISLEDTLRSFDLGLLARGWDCYEGTYHDMRAYFFQKGNPNFDPNGPLPWIPGRLNRFRKGRFSTHVAFRQPERIAKYAQYGYDMSAVIPDAVLGYRANALYQQNKGGNTKDGGSRDMLAQIYYQIADLIEAEDWQELVDAGKKIVYLDALDQIYEALL